MTLIIVQCMKVDWRGRVRTGLTMPRWHAVPTDSRLYFYSFYSFTFNDFYLIGIDTTPVAVNTVACTPDDGCKHIQNMLSKTAKK
jgi:hypothetical protein